MIRRVIALDRRAVRRARATIFLGSHGDGLVAVYRSLLKRSSLSERETIVPMPRPVLEKS
jgi:hypothetical protein